MHFIPNLDACKYGRYKNQYHQSNGNGQYPSDLMTLQTNLSGPACGWPMQLQLTDGTEIIAQSSSGGVAGAAGTNNSGQCVLQQTMSFYPGCGSGCFSMFDLEPGCPPPRDNGATDTDEEWMDEDNVADLAQQQPGKIYEVIANERPSWQKHTANAKSVNRTSSTETLTSHNDMSFGVPSSGALAETTVSPSQSANMPAANQLTSTWPVEMNLFFSPGGTKVMLTIQPPYVASVTQEAIKLL
ncbi:hypothetical protein EI94DRAFT_1705253 [Lactarius quietus]|nr:hypothetical protein EI94DRAFT_1705253 [Lactarius quietus]